MSLSWNKFWKKTLTVFVNTLYNSVVSIVLYVDMAFYSLVALQMFFDGNAVWRTFPHNVIFFIPDVILVVTAILVLLYNVKKSITAE